jgi:hypothetical protein
MKILLNFFSILHNNLTNTMQDDMNIKVLIFCDKHKTNMKDHNSERYLINGSGGFTFKMHTFHAF